MVYGLELCVKVREYLLQSTKKNIKEILRKYWKPFITLYLDKSWNFWSHFLVQDYTRIIFGCPYSILMSFAVWQNHCCYFKCTFRFHNYFSEELNYSCSFEYRKCTQIQGSEFRKIPWQVSTRSLTNHKSHQRFIKNKAPQQTKRTCVSILLVLKDHLLKIVQKFQVEQLEIMRDDNDFEMISLNYLRLDKNSSH